MNGEVSPASIFWELRKMAQNEAGPQETSLDENIEHHVEWMRFEYMHFLVNSWLSKKIN
jgi:hypothetical protein